MDYIDLKSLIKAVGGSLKNIEVHGLISARLNRPVNLADSCKTSDKGFFVKMELFAIDLTEYSQYLKQNGYSAPDNIYMVNGSICAFVPQQGYKYPEFYSIRGTLRLGSKRCDDYLVLFNFKKESNNNWFLSESTLSDIYTENWTQDSACTRYILKSKEEKRVVHPMSVLNLPRFTHYEAKSPIVLNTPSLNEQLQEATNNVEISNIGHTPKFKYESRLEIKPKSSLLNKLEDISENAKSSKENFIESLVSKYPYPYDRDLGYLDYMVNGILNNLKHKPTPAAKTGRMLLTTYLKTFDKYADATYLGVSLVDYMIDNFDIVSKYLLNNDIVDLYGEAWDFCKIAFSNKEIFYGVIVAQVLGVSMDTMTSIALLCSKHEISLITLLNENPYALQFVSDLSYSTIEHIALCMGKSYDTSLETYRNIALINSYVNDSNDGSTVFERRSLNTNKLGVTLTEAKYMATNNLGTHLSQTMQDNIHYYISSHNNKLCYDLSKFKKVGYNYIQPISRDVLNKAVDSYVQSGLGVEFDSYVTSSKLLEKELFVYNTMYSLGETKTGYSSEDIDKYIDEYEEILGFKLEKEQRMGVHLIEHKAGALAGSAGSGKTTTSDCLVYVLSKLDPYLEFCFAAPTGKAAKRMQEVLKRPVKTMASQYKVGESSSILFEEDEDKDSSSVSDVHMWDENAMVTIDLIYSVLKKIGKSSCIYLFGDFNQLPPIGKGLPFKNLLRFLPCVFLKVSKRAEEGSQITDNSNRINNCSEPNNWKELVSGEDFFLAPCNEEVMRNLTVVLCKFYLNKQLTYEETNMINRYIGDLDTIKPDFNYTADDIQVVTPLAKANYKWGSIQLNNILQPIFNSNHGVDNTFVYQPYGSKSFSKFLIGDRVIHTDTNMYSMQWYSSYKDGNFVKRYGYGICNGEVGKIVAFYPAESCSFQEERDDKPEDFEYPQNLRNDETFKDNNTWFIVVEYFDYMSDSNFYILYRVFLNTYSDVNIGKAFYGDDLSKLNLFYAGTTHKLQGSQAKIIISLLGVVNFKGFITRNMMYTVYTRGENLVFALGSVGNESNSMLSRARKEIAEQGILTIGELLGD